MFSPTQYISIHKELFKGIYSHAGKIRDYNITKKEWVLDGDTVSYGSALNLRETLDYYVVVCGCLILEAVLGREDSRKKNAVLMTILLLLAGCGCSGRTVLPSEESGGQIVEESVISVAPLLTFEDTDSENLAGMLQQECRGMMVQLEAGQFLGSGVIYSSDESALVIVTAAHILTDVDGSVKVTFVDGWTAESDDFVLWEQADLAMVRLTLEQIPEERLREYRVVNIDREAYDKLHEGDGCIVMGSRSGVAEEAYEGTVLEPWIYMEDYGHYMIWVKAYGKPGMSGGGLFDQQGHFLGILSGISEDEEWAVVPLDLLLERL